MLWSEANEHAVGGLQPIGMPPLKNGVNQLFGHFCSLMAFNFVRQRVERTGHYMPSVIVLSFALEILSILTLATVAYPIFVKVTPTNLQLCSAWACMANPFILVVNSLEDLLLDKINEK